MIQQTLMPDIFLKLSAKEQAEILQTTAASLGRTQIVLEKDIWVCWALDAIFSLPDHPQMAFKGGTSLSKVYDAIFRFSEDIDITLDYRNSGDVFNPFEDGASNTQIKKFSKRLNEYVRQYSHDVLAPALKGLIADQFTERQPTLKISEDGQRCWINYNSVIGGTGRYVGDSILIELGGRNTTDPSEHHTIKPYLVNVMSGLQFPEAKVDVLSPKRTFWEKTTLIHMECHRDRTQPGAGRMSRHWYDLAMLIDHQIGRSAIEDRGLLEDVVRYKEVFFNAPYARYADCTNGALRLQASDTLTKALSNDYAEMQEAQMFFKGPPSFKEILARLAELEQTVNKSYNR